MAKRTDSNYIDSYLNANTLKFTALNDAIHRRVRKLAINECQGPCKSLKFVVLK